MRFGERSDRTRIGSDQNARSKRRRPIEERQAACPTIPAFSICEATGTQKPAEFKLNRLILFRTQLGAGLGIRVSRLNVLISRRSKRASHQAPRGGADSALAEACGPRFRPANPPNSKEPLRGCVFERWLWGQDLAFCAAALAWPPCGPLMAARIGRRRDPDTKTPARGGRLYLVAGTGFEPVTFRL